MIRFRNAFYAADFSISFFHQFRVRPKGYAAPRVYVIDDLLIRRYAATAMVLVIAGCCKGGIIQQDNNTRENAHHTGKF